MCLTDKSAEMHLPHACNNKNIKIKKQTKKKKK